MKPMAAVGAAAALTEADLYIPAIAIRVAILRVMTVEDMDRLVVTGTWESGLESAKSAVRFAVGERYQERAWDLGKLQAWETYADIRGRAGWPVRTRVE